MDGQFQTQIRRLAYENIDPEVIEEAGRILKD